MTTVLIVTTTRLQSELIKIACQHQPDLNVVGCASDKTQALALENNCDVMVISYDIPDALDLVKRVGPRARPATVVFGLPNFKPLMLHFFEAGAAGCVGAHESAYELVHAIRLAAAKHNALTAQPYPPVQNRDSLPGTRQQEVKVMATDLKNLTRREREILELISKGHNNREIANQLSIELGTTKNHVHNILDKLNVKSRRDAAVYYSIGLVSQQGEHEWQT